MLIHQLRSSEVEAFAELLMGTELGRNYYPTYEFLMKELDRGMKEDCLYIAYPDESEKEAVAVLWFKRQGAFHSFPYLHVIAVSEVAQGCGYGKQVMDFFEDEILNDGNKRMLQTKVFLLVNAENKKAINMYESRGYEFVTELESLYRKRMTENLMMKKICRQV